MLADLGLEPFVTGIQRRHEVTATTKGWRKPNQPEGLEPRRDPRRGAVEAQHSREHGVLRSRVDPASSAIRAGLPVAGHELARPSGLVEVSSGEELRHHGLEIENRRAVDRVETSDGDPMTVDALELRNANRL